MFEGIVSDLLNRFLGTYIENFNPSKLKIGIWGGDVQLKDLVIKQSALDELNLPIRPVYGYLETLTLKIPWSRMYQDPWEASVEGLMLLVVPNTSVAYDAEKEEFHLQESKQLKLQRIEEAKIKEKTKLSETKKDDTLIEKLAAQIIRNIQIEIKSIHVRYEDAITCPSYPFAAGAVLKNLSLKSTDANWHPGLDTAKLIYKLLCLDGFCVYWSPKTSLLSQAFDKKTELGAALRSYIYTACEDNAKPVLGPMNLTAKLQLNTKPHLDDEPYTIPKIVLDFVLKKLSVNFSRYQFQNIINLVDSLERMQKASLYRKHRPSVGSIIGNARNWWIYAYHCILEDIRRIKKNWSWHEITKHRYKCKHYKELYREKLKGVKLKDDEEKIYQQYEREMDVFNITLFRKQAEMEQERQGAIEAQLKKNQGWLGGWFSWNSKESQAADSGTQDLVKKFEEAITSEEKAKFYEIIGYSEFGVPDEVPNSFVDASLKFLLEELNVVLFDEHYQNQSIAFVSVKNVICSVHNRTAASSIKSDISMQSFEVKGIASRSSIYIPPTLVDSLFVSEEVPLIDVKVEINPLDGSCDNQIHVLAQPLNIYYHKETVNRVVDFFILPEDVSLQKLQAAALMKFEEVKEKSVTGMQSVIDNHSIMDLKIDIKASRLLLPESGIFDSTRSLIVINLGRVKVESQPRKSQVNLVQLAADETDPINVLEIMRSSSYDSFKIQLQEVQIMVSSQGEDWENAITSAVATPMHILLPMSVDVTISNCLITCDPTFPKLKVFANLPKISLSILDTKLIEATSILNTCFSDEGISSSVTEASNQNTENKLKEDISSENKYIDRLEKMQLKEGSRQPTIQMINMEIKFAIRNILLEIKKNQLNKDPLTLLKVNAKEMLLMIQEKTYDLKFELSLSKINVDQNERGTVNLIRTEPKDEDDVFIKYKFCKVDHKSPDLVTIYDSVSEMSEVYMTNLTVKLEQSSLLSLISFATELQSKIDIPETIEDTKFEKVSNKNELVAASTSKKFQRKKSFKAELGQVKCTFCCGNTDLLCTNIRGLSANILMRDKDIFIDSCLQEFSVIDPNPDAIYSNLIVMEDGKAWNAKIEIFQSSDDGLNFFDVDKYDTSLHLEIGTPKIVFITKTVMNVLDWIDHFQAAKSSIILASQAAAEAAKSNLKEVYQHCLKIKLQLVLKAPVIFIPHKSTSSHGLFLDLGKIILSNKFELGKARNEIGHPSVLDMINISIMNIKVSRKPDFRMQEEILLLKPLSLTMNVVRNLSVQWHKTIPEIQINGMLEKVQVLLSEDDLGRMLSIVQGNLNETTGSQSVGNKDSQTNQGEMSSKESDKILAATGRIYEKLSLTFAIDDVDLHLYAVGDDDNSWDLDRSSSCRSCEFAKMSLNGLKMNFNLRSDFSMEANLSLFDCSVDDQRKDYVSGITRMIEKKNSEKKIPIIEMSCIIMSNETYVHMKMAGIVTIIHLPFLLHAIKFVSLEVPEDMMAEEEMLTRSSSVMAPKKIDQKANANLELRIEELPIQKSKFIFNLNIEEPDIILVENLNSINTYCVFMHCEIKVAMEMTDLERTFSASMSNIKLRTCCYNPKRRNETCSVILARSNVTVESANKEHFAVTLGTLKFRLAPDSLELAMNILSSIPNTQELSAKESNETIDWSDLWTPKPIDFSSLPKLQIDSGEEPDESYYNSRRSTSDRVVSMGNEQMHLELEYLHITLETGSGSSYIPLLQLQSDCAITVKGFLSHKLTFDGYLSLEIAYFNPRLAIWEPLLEPVDKIADDGINELQPWSLKIYGHYYLTEEPIGSACSGSSYFSVLSNETDFVEMEQLPPVMAINIKAQDSLEFVLTISSIDILMTLMNTFMQVYKGEISVRHSPKAPFKLHNQTGLAMRVDLTDSGLKTNISEERKDIDVAPKMEVELFEVIDKKTIFRRHSSLVAECQILKKSINIQVDSLGAHCCVPITKADKRYFPISVNGQRQEKRGIVSSVTVFEGAKIITLSSCVKVKNELESPVDVYYMTSQGNQIELICSLLPQEESLLPFKAVYSPTSEIFLAVKGYNACRDPLVWRNIQANPNLLQTLRCYPSPPSKSQTPFIFSAVCDVEQIYWMNTSRRTLDSIMIEIHLKPCVFFHNLLPYAVNVSVPGSKKILMPGSFLDINHVPMEKVQLKVEILSYRGHDWISRGKFNPQNLEIDSWVFRTKGTVNTTETLDLGMHFSHDRGCYHFHLFCPFLMLNKTLFNISYKTDTQSQSLIHKKGDREPVLFSFRTKNFFGKKKGNIKLEDGEWSEKFPLDTVASAGRVECTVNGITYYVSIDIGLASSGLTKIVTFSPFYKAVNHAPYDLQYSYLDDQSHQWHTITSGEFQGIWCPGSVQAFVVRIKDTSEKTNPIHFDAPHTTLFKLNNKYGGIFVEVTVIEGGCLISMDKVVECATTVLVLNHLFSSSLTFWQENQEQHKIELAPQEMIFYTWDSAESRRLLQLSCLGLSPITTPLSADDHGKFEESRASWATWLVGSQRFLIVSENETILENPNKVNELERPNQQLDLSLSSIGLSLINDILQKEVMYMCITSSGVVWEHRKHGGKKFRPFTEDQKNLLEKAFEMYTAQVNFSEGPVCSHYNITDNLEVDFVLMDVMKPFKRKIRRVFQPGVWAQVQQLPSSKSIHMKVNKIQIDNHLDDVIFPVVFARVPPPKGVATETVPKSFFEMSITMSIESQLGYQFQYFRMLVQEFHLQVELPFVFAILNVFYPEKAVEALYTPEKYEKDSQTINQDLASLIAAQRHPSRRDFYHHLHLSPIKMHLSFSIVGLDSSSKDEFRGQALRLFLQSVGFTLTEVQDAVFRLAFFDRQNILLNWEGLQNEVVSHYMNQIIIQLYVLVLGLDVIGNPYGLLLGVTKGFEDLFYEPIQGAVEGPTEFAEGLFYGMRSLMGKTVGGAAGAFSKITGTIGKGLASLTLDDEYQRQRREDFHKNTAPGLESIARGGKTVIAGVVGGVTGVFTKPITGAKEEGVEGFFKGVGIGVVGLVTRPASGVIDFASGSLNAVMRATDYSESTTRVRNPRFFSSDQVIRPYNYRSAVGAQLLKEIEKGLYSETEFYVVHGLTKGRVSIFIVTDKRVLLVSKNDLLGQWKVEWMHTFDELSEAPFLSFGNIKLTVKMAKKKVFGIFGGGDNSKEVCLETHKETAFVMKKLEEAYSEFKASK